MHQDPAVNADANWRFRYSHRPAQQSSYREEAFSFQFAKLCFYPGDVAGVFPGVLSGTASGIVLKSS